MLLSIEGEEATAKTTLAYTAPLPIVGFSFDLGWERALYGSRHKEYFKDLNIKGISYTPGVKPDPKAWDDNDITIFELPQPVQLSRTNITGCIELWEYFISLFAGAAQGNPASVVIDTATVARRVKSDAYLQELQEGKGPPRKQLLRIEWGHPNGSINAIYTLMQNLKKNLITVHHLGDDYKPFTHTDGSVTEEPTGDKILEGWNKTYREVDVAVRNIKTDKKITAVFNKCGYNLDLEGQVIADPTWNDIVSIIESIGGYTRGLPKRA